MTVKELIEKLSNYNDDQTVAVRTICNPTKIEYIRFLGVCYLSDIREEDNIVVLYT